jgi:hypothetical protein
VETARGDHDDLVTCLEGRSEPGVTTLGDAPEGGSGEIDLVRLDET